MRLHLVNKLFFIMVFGGFFIKSPLALADGMTSPISITIQMAQETFMLSDAIEGKVVLTNAGVKIPAVFDVKIFLDGKSQQSFSISFNGVLAGENRFTLKDFSIRILAQAGQWRIIIKQQGLGDDYAATADFTVKGA